MKKVNIDSLLETPRDSMINQREWTITKRLKANGFFLLFALFAGNVGPGLFMVSFVSKYYLGGYFEFGFLASFIVVLFGYAVPHLLFLGRVGRFWRALLRPNRSWISRGFIFANMFLLFSFLAIVHQLPIIGNYLSFVNSDFYEIILIGGFVSAFLLAMYPGFIFFRVRAIPFWNSATLVPLFIVQSFGSGIALSLLLSHLHFSGVNPGLEQLLPVEAFLIVLSAILIIFYLWGRNRSGKAARASVRQLIKGRIKKVFIYGAISCEIVIPLALVSLVFLGLDAQILILAELIQLSGIFFFKFCLLNAGAYNKLYSRRLWSQPLIQTRRKTVN
jgi:formate-dependent nitrite reductase membrane component NrfD